MFLLLGLLIVALDARLGGLGWRYIAEFRLAVCVGFASFDAYCAGLRRPRLRWLLRVLVLALLLFTLSLTVLSLFL